MAIYLIWSLVIICYIFRLCRKLDGYISYMKSCDHMFDIQNTSLFSTKAYNIVQTTFLYFRIILIDSIRYMIVKCDIFGNSIHNWEREQVYFISAVKFERATVISLDSSVTWRTQIMSLEITYLTLI